MWEFLVWVWCVGLLPGAALNGYTFVSGLHMGPKHPSRWGGDDLMFAILLGLSSAMFWPLFAAGWGVKGLTTLPGRNKRKRELFQRRRAAQLDARMKASAQAMAELTREGARKLAEKQEGNLREHREWDAEADRILNPPKPEREYAEAIYLQPIIDPDSGEILNWYLLPAVLREQLLREYMAKKRPNGRVYTSYTGGIRVAYGDSLMESA